MRSAAPHPTPSKVAATPSADWQVAVRVWIERRGEVLLGDDLADLLSAIEQTSSISAAARMLGISYRHAWKLVQGGNTVAGEPLVSAAVGGVNGGGAQLTPRGKFALELFDQLRARINESAAGLLQNLPPAGAQAGAIIHLAAAISLQEAMGQLLTEYALRHPAIRVRAVYGASNELADHLLAGAPCDLFVSADPAHIKRLAAAKKIVTGSKKTVATNCLAAIGSQEEGAATSPSSLLQAKQFVLADPDSPLGKCSRTYLEQIGIYATLQPKLVLVDNSQAVLAAIRSGAADAGLAFASDAAKANGCRILFAIDPAEASLNYTAAVCRGKREADSQSLLDFFSTLPAQRCFRRCGLTLPDNRRGRN
jgi:molybdate transport system substrate-binding protein